jgi:hypothetical protein
VTPSEQDQGAQRAQRLGIQPGMTVQELGFDDDVEVGLRDEIVSIVGTELVDEEYDDVVDVVLMWWRDDDGDLVDGLVDALVPLADQGIIWLMTPKPGRPGHIEAEDIADAAPTAGLQQTSTISAGPNWQGTRLVAPRAKR